MKKGSLVLLVILMSLSVAAFPIKELGNCDSEKDCRNYCDEAKNLLRCIAYAEEYGLMNKEEAELAKEMAGLIKEGKTPGGCSSEKACEDYCNIEENLIECVDFAVRIGEISSDEAELVKQTNGKGPGDCRSREECDKYCEENMDKCIDYAVENNLLDEREAELAKKTGGKGPGGCVDGECDEYCNKKENRQICLDFSVKYGLMTEGEANILSHCWDKKECDEFCKKSDEQFDACIDWLEKQGGIQEKELRSMKIMYYDSPGGCKGREECIESFCSDDNEEHLFECEQYSVKLGLITEKQYEKWKEDYYEKKEESEKKDIDELKGREGSDKEVELEEDDDDLVEDDASDEEKSSDDGEGKTEEAEVDEDDSDEESDEANDESVSTGAVVVDYKSKGYAWRFLEWIQDTFLS
ncbi:MAG TPA: hypothetical protein VFF28_04125 [Candidatus Nanoarchaeia archaeon]|nr:hypothetical protein [Candidatus Nanoarchaeia archaeon]